MHVCMNTCMYIRTYRDSALCVYIHICNVYCIHIFIKHMKSETFCKLSCHFKVSFVILCMHVVCIGPVPLVYVYKVVALKSVIRNMNSNKHLRREFIPLILNRHINNRHDATSRERWHLANTSMIKQNHILHWLLIYLLFWYHNFRS